MDNSQIDQFIKVREGEGIVLSVSEELPTSPSFTIFPIPVNDILTLTFSSQEKATLSLYNINGKRVMQKEISQERKSIQIHCSNFASGMYIAELRTESTLARSKFLVKH